MGLSFSIPGKGHILDVSLVLCWCLKCLDCNQRQFVPDCMLPFTNTAYRWKPWISHYYIFQSIYSQALYWLVDLALPSYQLLTLSECIYIGKSQLLVRDFKRIHCAHWIDTLLLIFNLHLNLKGNGGLDLCGTIWQKKDKFWMENI